MKKVLFCSYREWASQIIKSVEKNYKKSIEFSKASTKDELLTNIKKENFDLIFFLGWSEIISASIVNNNFCICLHPSLLPKYRGGSPIQNQIINGEEESGISFFKMDENIDTGPTIYKEKFNIKDVDLDEVFNSIVKSGVNGLDFILKKLVSDDEIPLVKQQENEATFYKRRTEEMSEIQLEDFNKFTSKELHNKIRCLQDPVSKCFYKV